MPTPTTEAIVAAYGPRDAWEAAQIAKAAALDASSAELCRMIAAGNLSPEQAVALGQGIVALERASRLALGALQRRRTRAANKPAPAAPPPPPAPQPPCPEPACPQARRVHRSARGIKRGESRDLGPLPGQRPAHPASARSQAGARIAPPGGYNCVICNG
jgi:hypothetical protein